MNVLLKALGCRLNEAELQTWARQFQNNGHQICKEESSADLVVVNTCAVTQEAVKKSRQLIRKSQRNNPQAKIVISGCYASLDEKLDTEIEGIDLIVANKDKDRLVDITHDELAIPTMPSMATAPGEFSLLSPNRSRAFVKVQDGCRYRCTFCIVTVARGNERSRTIEEVVDEINALVSQGVKEVVLTGVHIGGYGSDHDSSLFELINAVLSNTDIPRLRLGSVEPWDLPDNFFQLFENDRFMPHLHLPLQSGSDTVLRRMARRCKTDDFQNLIELAREQVEGINISTDIIVGFPGETESEWRESMEFIESMNFSHIHIFSYSPREGTKAAGLSEQVSPDIKKQRSQALHKLAESMKTSTLEDNKGKTVPVLWESKHEAGTENTCFYYGYTPNFLRVKKICNSSENLNNTITLESIQSVADNQDLLLV